MVRSAGQGAIVPALATLVGIVLLSCGDGDGGGNAPTPTPIATPTATPAPTPTVLPAPFVVASGIVTDLAPAIAWGGDRYLVSFSRILERTEPDVAGVRLAADGAAADTTPLLLSDLGAGAFLSADTAQYSSPAIGFVGTGFGVFFLGFGTVAQFGAPGEVVGFTSVPQDGAPLLPATQVASQANVGMVSSFLAPPLAATAIDASFVGVFQSVLSGVGIPSLPSVLGDFVTVSSGTVTAAPPVVLLSAVPPFDEVIPTGSAPGAASNGEVGLAAWVETLTDISTQTMQASVSGALLDPGVAPTSVRLSSANVGSQGVAIASDGDDFLAVWSSTANGGASTLTEIRGMRYRPGTGALDPDGGFVIAGSASAKALGGVAFGGGGYLVVWLDGTAVRGARVATDGEVGAELAVDDGPAAVPAVASDGERFLAVFARSGGAGAGDLLGRFVAAR